LTQLEHFKLKLITAGDHAVGKTSVIRRFIGQEFSPDYSATMGVECYTKAYKNDSNLIDLAIWDLAGQVLYRDLTKAYIKGADLVIIMFDVTRRETFDNVKGWYNTIYTDVSPEDIPCMIIGNKIDLREKRVVSLEEGGKLAQNLKTLYVETSAKQNKFINEAFQQLIRKFIQIHKK